MLYRSSLTGHALVLSISFRILIPKPHHFLFSSIRVHPTTLYCLHPVSLTLLHFSSPRCTSFFSNPLKTTWSLALSNRRKKRIVASPVLFINLPGMPSLPPCSPALSVCCCLSFSLIIVRVLYSFLVRRRLIALVHLFWTFLSLFPITVRTAPLFLSFLYVFTHWSLIFPEMPADESNEKGATADERAALNADGWAVIFDLRSLIFDLLILIFCPSIWDLVVGSGVLVVQ